MTRRTFVKAAAMGTLPTLFAPGCRRNDGRSPIRREDSVEWIRPIDDKSDPVWGIRGGIAVGLWPTEGPRGLIRIYAPYLGQSFPRMVNFIAVEPVVAGKRGQSELEMGLKSGRRGLDMTTGNTMEEAIRGTVATATGSIEQADGVDWLSFYLATEPFRNGARPVIQVRMRDGAPGVVFRIHSAAGGAKMDSCVLTSTMGNYGRLRRLWLRGEVVDSRKAWSEPKLDKLGFTRWRAWDRERLVRQDGRVVVAATSDEADPAAAPYDPSVPKHWRYDGRPGTHFWRGPDVPGTVVRVNARPTYWGNGGPIPGGLAYENFELESPFAAGQEFTFGVSSAKPPALGFNSVWEMNVTGG
jgi:hypothetical protein